MLKRITLFLAVNFLIIMTVSLLMQIFHVGPYLNQYGLDMRSLALFCLIWGMGGAFISLLLSRKIAKWMFSIKIIDPQQLHDPQRLKLYEMVVKLSQKIGLPEVPQVGIFHSNEPNAFATGPSKRSSLIAVSSGLLDNLNEEEIEAVVGHELSHIASGDMVTMTLLQGVVNAFVMFLARLLAFFLSGLGNKDRSSRSGSPMSFYLLTFLFEVVFMIFGSMIVAAYSRFREYRADHGSAQITSPYAMIGALTKLQALQSIVRGPADKRMQNAAALMVTTPRVGRKKWFHLFFTHPPLEARIAALQKLAAQTPADMPLPR